MSMKCPNPPSSFALAFDGPISFFVIVGGVLGNLYSLKQLFSRSINTTMLVSLTALAISDTILLLAAFDHHSLWATLQYFSLQDNPWDNQMTTMNGLVELGNILSTWMLIVVTLERFIAVTRPFKYAPVHRKQRRKSHARFVIGMMRIPILMTFVACFVCLPCAFEYELIPCMYKGKESQMMVETTQMQNMVYKITFRTVLLPILKTFGPFVIITFLTISTLKTMRKSMDSRASILIAQGQDHIFQSDKEKTKSLETISRLLLCKFFLFCCVSTFLTIFQMFFGTNNFVLSLSQFLPLLNSATNCFVFVVVKSAFETRRIQRIRQRHRELVAQHAEQVLSIGKALAGDKLLLITDVESENHSSEEETFEMKPMVPPSTSNPV